MMSKLRVARMVVRRETDTAAFLGSLIAALLATLVSFAAVDGIFSWVLREYTSTRTIQNAPDISLPSHNWKFVLPCFLVGLTAISMKQWVLPLVAGMLVYAVFIIPQYGGSGSITNFMPLVNLHMELVGVALVLNVLIAAIWITESKRSSCVVDPILPIATSSEH